MNYPFVSCRRCCLLLAFIFSVSAFGVTPVITEKPTKQTVSVGETASFSLTALGTLPMYDQWFGPTNNLIPEAHNPTLRLSNVQPSNAGTYFAVVTNI